METSTRGPGKPRALSPEKEEMAATLRCAGYGIASIAELFAVHPRTLHAILKRQGVETNRGRRRLTVAQEEEVRALRGRGWTLIALAEQFGVSKDTVRATTRAEQS
ncbi:hypothetical protein [Microbacterium caowuchunii]|uniref:hypothetical protein n=1 Tax=Microbacterium caowuchunii TaxID=2614638 RepID=UPI001784A817|nr:hypothetical protein [Microbacterium caowuchunii]